jgi:hypothetical protein
MPLHGNLRAIVAMIADCAMFGCMDAVLKALSGTYPPLQVTALRGLTASRWCARTCCGGASWARYSAAICVGGCTCCAG